MTEYHNSKSTDDSTAAISPRSRDRRATFSSRRRLLGLLGATSLGCIAGCTQGESTDDTKTPDTPTTGENLPTEPGTDPTPAPDRELRDSIKLGIYQDPSDFKGTWGNVRPDWTRIFDPLVYPTADLKAEPWLATDWNRTGESTWEFYLRDNVKFHNGKPLTAETVVFTFETLLQRDFWTVFFNMEPDGIRAVDDLTVEMTTTQPTAELQRLLAYPATAIQHPDRTRGNPIGTGPYKYEDHLPGQYVKVSAFEDHWNGPPKTDNITFRIIKDRNTRAQALVSGNVDVALRLPASRNDELANRPEFKTVSEPRPNSSHISFNTAKSPTDDLKLRKALNYAVSQRKVVAGAKNGLGIPANGFIPPLVPWAAEDSLPSYGPDKEKAKRLVSESSYDGETLRIVGQSSGRFSSGDPLSAQVIQQEAKDIGVDIDIRLMGPGAYADAQETGDAGHLWLTGSGSYRVSSLFFVRQIVERYGPKPTNLDESMPEVVEELKSLIDKGVETDDRAVKHQAFKKVQHIAIADQAIYLPLYYRKFLLGMKKDVGDFDWAAVIDTSKWENLEFYK